jgi:hypothetical protein
LHFTLLSYVPKLPAMFSFHRSVHIERYLQPSPASVANLIIVGTSCCYFSISRSRKRWCYIHTYPNQKVHSAFLPPKVHSIHTFNPSAAAKCNFGNWSRGKSSHLKQRVMRVLRACTLSLWSPTQSAHIAAALICIVSPLADKRLWFRAWRTQWDGFAPDKMRRAHPDAALFLREMGECALRTLHGEDINVKSFLNFSQVDLLFKQTL